MRLHWSYISQKLIDDHFTGFHFVTWGLSLLAFCVGFYSGLTDDTLLLQCTCTWHPETTSSRWTCCWRGRPRRAPGTSASLRSPAALIMKVAADLIFTGFLSVIDLLKKKHRRSNWFGMKRGWFLKLKKKSSFFGGLELEKSSWTAPQDCLQYFTEATGTFSSFNYQFSNAPAVQHLANQDYTVCIRMAQVRILPAYHHIRSNVSWIWLSFTGFYLVLLGSLIFFIGVSPG